MLTWLRRIESGTTTWRDAEAAIFWLALMFGVGFVAGAVLVWLLCSKGA